MYRENNRFGRRGGNNMQSSTAPVKVGDELTVTIEAVGEKGDGVAKKDGFVLFVPGVKEGETIRIRVTKVLRKVGFAEKIGEGDASEAPAEPAEEAPAESDDFGEESESENLGEEPEESEDFGDSDDFGDDEDKQQ